MHSAPFKIENGDDVFAINLEEKKTDQTLLKIQFL